jgi:hypothetical protein
MQEIKSTVVSEGDKHSRRPDLAPLLYDTFDVTANHEYARHSQTVTHAHTHRQAPRDRLPIPSLTPLFPSMPVSRL